MKKFVLAFMLLLLLAGCDAAKLTGAKQEESSLPDISSVPASISQAESSQAGAGASSNLPAEFSGIFRVLCFILFRNGGSARWRRRRI